MQTEEIKIQKSVIGKVPQETDDSKTFFQKIVSWFRDEVREPCEISSQN